MRRGGINRLRDKGSDFVFLRLELFDFGLHGLGLEKYLLSLPAEVGILLVEFSGAGGGSVDPMLDDLGVALWPQFLVTGPASLSNRDFGLAQGLVVGDAVLKHGVVDVEGFLNVGRVLGGRGEVPRFVRFLCWLGSMSLAWAVFAALVYSGAVPR